MPTVRAHTLVAIVTLQCLLLPGLVWAQQTKTVISTGLEGGSYFSIGKRLASTMKEQQGLEILVQTSSGSVQNLGRLADPSSRVGLALTQTDALSRFLLNNAGFEKEFIVLGDAGKECVVLISSKTGGIGSFADLKRTAGAEISVDDPGSGASATFDYLQAMDPSFAKTKAVYVDAMEALLQIKVAGALTGLKAIMRVQRPSLVSPPVKVVLENPQDYRLVPILEADVENSRLPDGSAVYSFERVAIGGAGGGSSLPVDTICTRGLLLASKKKLNRDMRSKLSTSMIGSSDAVIGK